MKTKNLKKFQLHSIKSLFEIIKGPTKVVDPTEDPAIADVIFRYTRTGIVVACIPGGRKENEPKTKGIPPNLTLIQGGQS